MIKQHNESAVNFALAGIMSFIIAMILLFFLWQNITTEKQMTELQTTGQRLAKVVASQNFAEGDAKTFAEFAQLVKSFNQQWDDFKQLQKNYPIEKIKEIDEIKDQLNTHAPKWLALQKDIVAQTLAKKELYSNTQKMRQMNDELLNMLLRANADKQQILTVQQISLNLSQSELVYKRQIEGLVSGTMHSEEEWYPFYDIDDLLKAILNGSDKYPDIVKINDITAVKKVENEIILYNKIKELNNNFNLFLYKTPSPKNIIKNLNAQFLSLNNKSFFIIRYVGYIFCLFFIFYIFINYRRSKKAKPVGILIFVWVIVVVTYVDISSKSKEIIYQIYKIQDTTKNINSLFANIDSYNDSIFEIFKLILSLKEQSLDFNKIDMDIKYIKKYNLIFEIINQNFQKIKTYEMDYIDFRKNKGLLSMNFSLRENIYMYYSDENIIKHQIQYLLLIKELEQRLSILYDYSVFSYYYYNKSILEDPIDLTLSDYIAILRKNPNMANADYTIDPEIQNKIKTLNTEIEAFKESFRAALAVKEAALAIRDKNLELNAELTRLYNQQIIKELMIMTLYSWLCVFFCGVGYVRAIKAEKK